jgi:hypothetical protein
MQRIHPVTVTTILYILTIIVRSRDTLRKNNENKKEFIALF